MTLTTDGDNNQTSGMDSYPNEPESVDDLKERLREQFGVYSDDDLPDYLDKCHVGAARFVVWVPESADQLGHVKIDDFTPSEGWEMGKAAPDDSAELQDIYGIEYGDTSHAISAEILSALADILGVTEPELLDEAYINPDRENWPVLFTESVPCGRVFITPIASLPATADSSGMNY